MTSVAHSPAEPSRICRSSKSHCIDLAAGEPVLADYNVLPGLLDAADQLAGQTRSTHLSAQNENRSLHASEQRTVDRNARVFDRLESAIELVKTGRRVAELKTDRNGGLVPDYARKERSAASRAIEPHVYGHMVRASRPGEVERKFWIPTVAEYRAALATSPGSAGGYIAPPEHVDWWIESLRPASVVLTAGPRIHRTERSSVHVPKVGASSTAAMTAENALIAEGGMTFAEVVLTPRKAAGLLRVSNELMNDSSPSARAVIQDDLARTIALLLDEQMLVGNGTPPNLRGLANTTGSTSTPVVTALKLDDIAAAIARMEGNNLPPTAIFMSPEAWAALKTEKDSQLRYQLGPDPTAPAERRLFGVTVFVTPQVGEAVLVVSMPWVIVAINEVLNIVFDQSRYLEYDQTGVRATGRVDIAPMHPEAVEILTMPALGRTSPPPARK